MAKDSVGLVVYFDFTEEQWNYPRTTNPTESTFAAGRLRTAKPEGAGSRQACLTMVFRLARSAETSWHKLDGRSLLVEVIRCVWFQDGLRSVTT